MTTSTTGAVTEEAERELFHYLRNRQYDGLPVWATAIAIAKELQIPPWEVLGEARSERDWTALAIASLSANARYIEWHKKLTRR